MANKIINRVLMIVDAAGGVWTYANELVKEYKKRNIEVVMVVMGPPPDRIQRAMIRKLDNVVLIEGKYKLEWMDNPWDDVDDAAEWLLGLEILFHPDVIHLNGFCHAALAWHAPVMVVAHSCVCSWFEYVNRTEIPVTLLEYKRRVSEGLKSAEYVIAPSSAMLQSLFRHYGQIDSAAVIYNGIKMVSDQKVGKEPFVLTCGRIWDEAKNIEAVASIASKLKWNVYAAGEGSLNGNEYKNFKILGKLSQSALHALMSKAPLFVLPSKYEPFGLSILEAANSGCALILGDIPSLREIWQDNAIFVNPNNHEELKDAINECIKNVNFREKFAQKALMKAREYNSEIMADNYLELYENMVVHKSNLEINLNYASDDDG